MIRKRVFIFALLLLAVACAPVDNVETIALLRNRQIEIRAAEIEGGLEKAMASYQRFLEETPDSNLAPEAIRRLADLKVEKEYGLVSERLKEAEEIKPTLPAPESAALPEFTTSRQKEKRKAEGETEADFELRTTHRLPIAPSSHPSNGSASATNDLEKAGPLEAIVLYQKLLDKYPLYERNDQVLYQMSRAYEELGRVEEAMSVMNRLVNDFPDSRYLDEVQFRRAEYFFTRRKLLDAEDAYRSIVDIGVGSSFYQLALYKLGWTFYKQELYEEALHEFIALLDYKVSVGYDFEQTGDESERKRMEDTFRVISLSFSYIGGADSVVEYFSRNGERVYEDSVYSNLGEYYFNKRRYADAVKTYDAFVSRNPFHKVSPNFQMRIIEINVAGGFPTLVIAAKEAFATTYGLKAKYWEHFVPEERPEVLADLKTNLTDLANHYHALYRNPKQVERKPVNFDEAQHWYRQFLVSFPQDAESPAINYQLADLLLENNIYDEAAVEYEKTAYDYPAHEKSATAGYAAVYAYRQQLVTLGQAEQIPVKREVVRSSLKFAETFPDHDKAAIVLGAAADDLYAMSDYEQALSAGRKLIGGFPDTEADIRRGAWLIVAHSSYELQLFADAESAYVTVLDLLPEDDTSRAELTDNLAASIYKQGEQANAREELQAAADHYLRVGVLAPTSPIRVAAEYDAAAVLIRLEAWDRSIAVLTRFRENFPGHELQPEVTKKVAYVYRQSGQIALAAGEYERIERESDDDDVRREALLLAADLYAEAGNKERTLVVFRRYVDYFPQPVEINLETRNKIADILKAKDDREGYLVELERIVTIEDSAGEARTDRTRYLAAKAALVLAEESYRLFVAVDLVQPFETNLRKKQKLMKSASQDFSKLLNYEIGEVTAAATFYLAEIYAHFSKSLMTSERPSGLSPLEMEQYELAIEEQAYPFEEKAISVHESNLELIPLGIYNGWIDRSLERLARFVPARYARPEEVSEMVTSLDTFTFSVDRPSPLPAVEPEPGQYEPVVTAAPAQNGEAGEKLETEAEKLNNQADTGAADTEADRSDQKGVPVQAVGKEPSAVFGTGVLDKIPGDATDPPDEAPVPSAVTTDVEAPAQHVADKQELM